MPVPNFRFQVVAEIYRSSLARRVSVVVFIILSFVEALLFWPLYEERKHHLLDDFMTLQEPILRSANHDFSDSRDISGYANFLLRTEAVFGVYVSDKTSDDVITVGESLKALEPGGVVEEVLLAERLEKRFRDRLFAPKNHEVIIRFNIRSIYQDLENFTLNYVISSVIASISVAILLVVALFYTVIRPMGILRDALLREEEGGEFDFPGALGRKDEIGAVFRETVKLVTYKRQSEKNLGQLVLDRTLELTEANGRLRTLEAQTRAKEFRIRAILDNSPSFIYLKDRQGRYLLVNRRVEESLGMPVEEIVGRTPFDLYPRHLAEKYEQQDKQVIASKQTVVMEAEVPQKGGKPRASILYKFPVFGAVGEVESVGAVIVDIEDRVRAEEALKEQMEQTEAASKSKSDLVATVSHEVRTPMNGVLGMARLLRETKLDEDQRETLETVISSAESLLRIVNDLLDISKLEAGHLELEEIPFLPRDMVQQSIALLSSRAVERGLDLTLEIDPATPPVVKGDPYRLHQVLINLISNAIKFTPKGSVAVSVTASESGENKVRLGFAVTDTGSGISKDAQEKLFSPFTQGAIDVARKYGGTGLGLAICRRLVNLMGGEIALVSKVGEGSRFSFEIGLEVMADIPEESLRAEPVAIGETAQVPSIGRPLSVLQVEDNETNQALIEKLLRARGHKVVTAPNGKDALIRLRQQRFDLVIMDRHMPVMDGLEATRKIRELAKPLCDIPVLGVTAGALDYEQAACLEAGMNMVLTKPVEEARLLNAMAHLTDAVEVNRHPILIVDDIELNLLVVRKQLEQLGLASEWTTDPQQALEWLKTRSFSAAIVDKEMPKLDGVALTRQFREWEEGQHMALPLPIIGISGHISKEERDICLAAGMTAYLTKPVPIEDFKAALLAANAMHC